MMQRVSSLQTHSCATRTSSILPAATPSMGCRGTPGVIAQRSRTAARSSQLLAASTSVNKSQCAAWMSCSHAHACRQACREGQPGRRRGVRPTHLQLGGYHLIHLSPRITRGIDVGLGSVQGLCEGGEDSPLLCAYAQCALAMVPTPWHHNSARESGCVQD